MMNWKYYFHVLSNSWFILRPKFVKGTEKITKYLSQDSRSQERDLKAGPPESEEAKC
jgi:hypothetical protein